MGKRKRGGDSKSYFPDHPHVRGEKSTHNTVNPQKHGSSPRAWGKDRTRKTFFITSRIIPTCVGKSMQLWAPPIPATDHPHVRGEKRLINVSRGLLAGSSPRAWGKAHYKPFQRLQIRIIPTCVGKSMKSAGYPPRATDHPHVRGEKEPADTARTVGSDHPHVRGEKASLSSASAFLFGSSPRAWGKDRRARCCC